MHVHIHIKQRAFIFGIWVPGRVFFDCIRFMPWGGQVGLGFKIQDIFVMYIIKLFISVKIHFASIVVLFIILIFVYAFVQVFGM